jgi:hypothetical protein
MVTENGFSIAPFHGNQKFSTAIERRHVICFWKAFDPHHWMATKIFGHHKVWQLKTFGHHTLWRPIFFSNATRYGDLSFLVVTWFRATKIGLVSVAHKLALGRLKMFLT